MSGKTSEAPPAELQAWKADVAARVGAELDLLFTRERQRGETLGPAMLGVIDAVADLTCRGGKRLRPLLVAAGYQAAAGDEGTGSDLGPAVAAGVAFELLHSYFLIHDDWMDDDDVRRSGPAVHVLMRERFRSRRLGDAAAVLAGDYTAGLAWGALAGAPAASDRVLRALRYFARVEGETVSGQILDVTGSAPPVPAYLLEDLKTCSYTVRGPLVVGGLLAGAGDATVSALTAFADPLGVAFQLRDDLLGVFGTVERTGKPAASDLRAGKRTVLVREALRRSDPAGRRLLESVLGRSDAAGEELAGAVAAVADSGAAEYLEQTIADLLAQALAVLDRPADLLTARGRTSLRHLALALTARTA